MNKDELIYEKLDESNELCIEQSDLIDKMISARKRGKYQRAIEINQEIEKISDRLHEIVDEITELEKNE